METKAERALRLKRRASKLRALGKPRYVFPHEFEEVLAILRQAHDVHGMSAKMIAEQAGIKHSTTVARILRGEQKGITRPYYEAIKALTFRRADPHLLRSGARINHIGTARRLHALVHQGYPFTYLGERLDKTRQGMQTLARPDRAFAFGSTAVKIAELYDELSGRDPADCGVTPDQMRRARQAAERRGFLPGHVWDNETIDDPDAHPEWTGACGTREGREIHERDGIPMCDACAKARAYRVSPERDWYLDAKYLVSVMERNNVSNIALAEAIGVARDTVSTWRVGRRSPSPDLLEKMADHLGVHVSELRIYV